MWSLDGVMRYLPIAALHDGKEFAVEKYRNVVYTPASKPRLKDRVSAKWKGLALGVSKAHKGFQPLPGVLKELHRIIREEKSNDEGVLPGTVRLDDAFTNDAMIGELRKRFELVHIASHFQFRPGNETDSFLLLGDGSHMTLGELKNQPNIFGGVELLTLSACDTATGGGADGKEVEGFAVLAQRKGAKAVVASLWPVVDESTSLLMQEFYRHRETISGTPKAEALRQGQLALLRGTIRPGAESTSKRTSERVEVAGEEKETDRPLFKKDPRTPYAHPYYWAAFILIGNWR
jgi:CHAT domain-containing protein